MLGQNFGEHLVALDEFASAIRVVFGQRSAAREGERGEARDDADDRELATQREVSEVERQGCALAEE